MAEQHELIPPVPREIADGIYRAAIHYRDRIRELGKIQRASDLAADAQLAAYLDHRPRPPQREPDDQAA